MTRRTSRLAIIAAVGAMAAGTAFAGPIQMKVTSGSYTTTFFTTTGSSYSNSDLSGWNVTYFTPVSNSPSAQPFGLDLGGFAAACENSSGCDSLTVSISATGFTTPVGINGFSTGLVNNNLTGPNTMTGKVMQTAYYGLSDNYMDESNAIGSITLNGFGGQYKVGGGPAPGPNMTSYSLTLVDTLSSSCTTNQCAVFSIDGSIAGNVPEPGTLALFGAGLLGCALAIARRRRGLQR